MFEKLKQVYSRWLQSRRARLYDKGFRWAMMSFWFYDRPLSEIEELAYGCDDWVALGAREAIGVIEQGRCTSEHSMSRHPRYKDGGLC